MFHGALHAACCRIARPTRRVAHSAGLRRCLVVPGVCAAPHRRPCRPLSVRRLDVVSHLLSVALLSVACRPLLSVACRPLLPVACRPCPCACLAIAAFTRAPPPCCMPSVARCVLHTARCVLHTAHCTLHVARCMLSVACCAAAHERQCVKIKTSAAACHSSTVERAKTSPAPCLRTPGTRVRGVAHKVSGRCGRVQRYLKRAHDHALLPEPRTPTATAPSATPACGRNPHRTCVRTQVRT
jgi:hypothetical protein